MLNNFPLRLKALLLTLFVLYTGVTFFSFASLYESPYTGLRLSPCEKSACITGVDPGSPAYVAGIRAGDELVMVNNESVPPFVFSQDPDYVRWKKDREIMRHWVRKFENGIRKEKRLDLSIIKAGNPVAVMIVPIDFPLASVLIRTLPVYIVSWASAILAVLVLRKKMNHISFVNFLFWSLSGLAALSFAGYTVRDLAFSAFAMQALSRLNTLGAVLAVFLGVHFVLIFPERKKLLDTRPWTLKALYGGAAVLCIISLAEMPNDMHAALYAPMTAGLVFIMFRFYYDFIKERNPIVRKQIQWVVLGMTAASIVLLSITLLPTLFGLPKISEEISYLVMIIPSACFAVAVTRYRMMDIENIFDAAVVYGFTILILEGAELAFLAVFSPYLPSAGRGPLLAATGVLLIVFLYVPLRNSISKKVESFFKRGAYGTEEEIQKFIAGFGVCDNIPAVEKFSLYAEKLLGPSNMAVISFKPDTGEILACRGEKLRYLAQTIVSKGHALIKYFNEQRSSRHGYDLVEKGLFEQDHGSVLENALFVPFFADNEMVFLAVLGEKMSGTAYSRKDRKLLDLIALQLSSVVEAEERRRELESERLRLAREIHDGVGSEFTGIISFCEKGERLAASPGNGHETEVLGTIAASARRGMQELRNIVWALNMDRQSFGYLSSYIKRYATDFLLSDGIAVTMKEASGFDELLSPQLFLTAFRTVQESCHNILKHARADKVKIELGANGGWLELCIEDNGCGLSSPARDRKTGHGVRNLRKRAEDIGGAIEFTKSSMGGTAVRARFPMG